MLRTMPFLIFILILCAIQPAKAEEMAEAVIGVTVAEGTVSPTISAVGTFTAYNDVFLKSETYGRIQEIHFKEGDHVKPDQKLFTLHNEEQKLKVQKAKAAVKLSKNRLKRKQTLVEKKFISPEAFEEVEYKVEADKADLQLAQQELEKTEIRAPFDGDLSSRVVSIGTYVNEGDKLVRIQDITPIRLIFQLPQKEVINVKAGDRVVAGTDLYPKKNFEGSIEIVEPRIDEQTRTVTVYATFPNKEKMLIPGLYGQVNIETSGKKVQSVLVPEQALVMRPDGVFVYVIEKDKAVLTKVTLGSRTGDKAQILSGLKAGSPIVLEGQDKIHDGSLLTVEMK